MGTEYLREEAVVSQAAPFYFQKNPNQPKKTPTHPTNQPTKKTQTYAWLLLLGERLCILQKAQTASTKCTDWSI